LQGSDIYAARLSLNDSPAAPAWRAERLPGKARQIPARKAGLTSDSLKPGERPSQVLVVVADLLTGKRASRAHIGGMDQILPPELNDLEFEALRQLAAHPITHHIPSRIQSRLKDIGYAKEVLGGIVLTKDGLQRISEGK
jgi:hypothetical protein